MSFSIPVPRVPNCSFPFAFSLSGSARFYFHSLPSSIGYSHFRRLPVPYQLVSHRTCCCFFMDIIKQINSKLTTNGCLLVSETTDIKLRYKYLNQTIALQYRSFSQLNALRRLISLFWVGNGKTQCCYSLPFPSTIQMLFPIFAELEQCSPFPWDLHSN